MTVVEFGNKALNVDPDRIRISFSPEVLDLLRKMEAKVRNRDEFGSDEHGILETLAEGKPMNLGDALGWLAMVGEEAGRYSIKTGDDEPATLLIFAVGRLSETSNGRKPLLATLGPKDRSYAPGN